MSNITDFINNELYPVLFERVDSVFSTMGFQRYRGGWSSPNKLDGTRSHDNRKDKSVITSKQPNRVIEQGGESKDLITLFKEQNNYSSDIEAIKALCNLLGLTLPDMENSESYRAYQEKQEKLEAAAERMEKALLSSDGVQAINYLKDNRKYTEQFIKWANFGFCSMDEANTLRALFTYTNNTGDELCSLPKGVGDSYILAIPYRTGGRIVGFVFRATDQTITPKYKDAFISASASKRYHLFGLTGLKLTGNSEKDKDITIVEGEIDALRGQYSGVENIVAAAGGVLSREALHEAKSRGVKRITILFDTEETEEKQQVTNKKIEKAIEAIYAVGLAPFVAVLPTDGGKCDVDSYLQNHTGEELQAVIDNAITGALFLFDELTREAIERQGVDNETATFKNLHEFKSRTIELANRACMSPTDRDSIFTHFQIATGDYITKESIQDEANRLKGIADTQKQKNDTLNTIKEAYSLANGTEADGVEKALHLLEEKVKPLQEISKEAAYSKLLLSPSTEGIRNSFKERPTGIATNFAFGMGDKREQFLLQSGALTYICAPTSHGKSRMLENLAIQLSTNGGEGDVLYFSFEEDSEAVKLQLLNIFVAEALSRNNLRSLNTYYRTGANYFTGDKLNDFKKKEAQFFRLLTTNKLRVFSEDYDSTDLTAAIRYLYKHIKVKAVFVDYIQLLHTRGSGTGRKEELADMCRNLMGVTKNTGLPIVLAAQLNREALSPIEMAAQNIAEASEIEHSANTIMLLWNSVNEPLQKSNYFYTKSGERKLSDEAQRLDSRGFHIGQEGQMYAKLAKNRGGARNIDAILSFDGNTGVIAQPDYTPPTGVEQSTLSFEEIQETKGNTLPF